MKYRENLDAFLDENSIDELWTIDPGWNTAITRWNKGGISVSYITVPEKYRAACDNDEIRMGDLLISKLDEVYHVHSYRNELYIIIEDVSLRTSSPESIASASSGYLFVVSKLIGRMIEVFGQINAVIGGLQRKNTQLVLAQQWKGNMKDKAVRFRVERETGRTFPNQHLYDSTGIGLSKLNNWRITK